jgi:hypothetical protein
VEGGQAGDRAPELRRRLAQARRRLQEREAELERAREQADERGQKLEQRAGELSRRLESRTAALAEARRQLGAERERLAAAEERLQAAERRLVYADPAVFYVVGHAKSGTTWLMRLLDAHPEIVCKGEGRIFGRRYKRPDVRKMDAPTFQPSSLYRALIDATYLRSWIERSVWTRGDDADEQLRGLTRAAIHHFLGARLAGSKKRIVGDKTPFLSDEIITEIAEIDSGAKVIHIIRDGRDVAVSGIHHLWRRELDLGGGKDIRPEEEEMRARYRADPQGAIESGEGLFTEQRLREMAEDWRRQVSAAREQGSELLGTDRYVEVRYEELLERTVPEFRRLAGFLGADQDSKVAQRCVSSASFTRWTKGRRRGQEDSDSLLRKGVAGDWKRVFTADDRRVFDRHAGDLLIELGYETGRDWV